ncbi:EpsG family protein [Floccifex sp.]|uniref:EpsG family protein n=1 Tax=Floccifex sp. TaxID=2815810 RepID=UPI002A765C86|nr:EpsG family protein [Floccifex sp.]MDY2957678.1 EpsG family protein [Floccifex sp.]
MIVLLILLSAVLLAFLLRKSDKIVQLIPFIILFLFSVFRYQYGNDYLSYNQAYLKINSGYESFFSKEILFTTLNKISPNFRFFLILTSLIFVGVLTYFLMKNLDDDKRWMGILILVINPYLFLINLSAIRQGLAIAVFVIAAYFLWKRKIIWYALCIIIASLFHKSAIILLPIYFIVNDKKNSVLPMVMIIMLIVSLLWSGFDELLIKITSLFDDTNYNYYVSQGMSNSIRATLLSSLYLIYTFMNLKKLEGKELAFGKLYLIGCIFSVLAFRLSMFTRIQMYFDIFSIVALPAIFSKVQAEGNVVLDASRPVATLWNIVNKYAMPILLALVYFLRFYSFMSNPLWSSFTTYNLPFM